MTENSIILLTRKTLTLVSLIFLMLLFQNCGVSEENGLDDISSAEQSAADALPFAFDVTVDQIAYMSCDSNSVNQSGKLFNFKAGAFGDNEGIKIRNNFRSSIGAKSKAFVLRSIAASKRNSGAGVVMSVREGSKFQGPVKIGNSDGGSQEDAFGNIIAPLIWSPGFGITLSSEKVADFLWDRPDGVNYLEGFPALIGKSFEGEISYNAQGAQQIIRDSVESDAYLTFTFAIDDLNDLGSKARSPSSETGVGAAARNSVWGKGYKMEFAQMNPSRPGSPRRALSGLTGFNLENESSLDESWVCPVSERYIIVKNADALRRYDAAPFNRGAGAGAVANNPWDDEYDPGPESQGGYMMNVMIADSEDIDDDGDSNELISVRRKVVCPTIPDNITLGSSEHEIGAWTRIRNILPSEDWYVFRGPRYNCVVPKQTNNACYGRYEEQANNTQAPPIIQYLPDEDMPEFWIARKKADEARDIIDTVVVRETECEGPNTPGRFCPQVVSVCHKR
jgi:hypothetical protein